jgi:hypothetical protein
LKIFIAKIYLDPSETVKLELSLETNTGHEPLNQNILSPRHSKIRFG